MEQASSMQEIPNGVGEAGLQEAPDHSYGKSSHAFRTISEVSEEIDVPQHVLRFWESKFGQIRPLKRGGGRRYYRPEDIELLKRIKNYLYKQGYTIKGVQRLLKEKRQEAVSKFVPYASPLASMPGYPFEQALQTTDFSVASYLHAASAAPSALAMAYGSIGGQIAERAGQHQFEDAFEETTTHIVPEKTVAQDQIEKSLFAVTQIHDEISAHIQPIRITNPSAPALDDVADDVVSAAQHILAEQKTSPVLEFNFEAPATSPELAMPDVTASAAQPSPEMFIEDEFNQDVVEEDVPVKRLDDAAQDDEAEIVDAQPDPQPIKVELGAYEEIVLEHPQIADYPPPTPLIAPEKKEALLSLLDEMVALRALLQTQAHI